MVAHQLARQSLASYQLVVPIIYQTRRESQNSWFLESQRQPPSPPSLYVTPRQGHCQRHVKERRGNYLQKTVQTRRTQRTKLFRTAMTLTGVYASIEFESLTLSIVCQLFGFRSRGGREKGAIPVLLAHNNLLLNLHLIHGNYYTHVRIPISSANIPRTRQLLHSRKNIDQFC